MKKIVFISALILSLCGYNHAQKDEQNRQTILESKFDWWKDARFGMFIHWGVYAVPAGEYKGEKVAGIGEWIMQKAKIPVAEYKEIAGTFNPVDYDPEEWVKLAKKAGMKYIVITAKHHDGFALFESKVSTWNVVEATPYGKDLLTPLAEACKKHGIRLGFYYSHAQDWVHPGGVKDGGAWDEAQNGSMDEYLRNIAVPQVEEILSNYGQIDILWWDTPMHMTRERAEMFLPVIEKHPHLITNSRLGGGFEGDFHTPEGFIPAIKDDIHHWETCMTMNGTWGYKKDANNWRSSEDFIKNLVEIVSKGGNYLLNVGPDGLGNIPEGSVRILHEVGEWLEENGEAIYGTQNSPFHYMPWGGASSKGNKVFLFVHEPENIDKLNLPLLNKIEKAYLFKDKSHVFKVNKYDKYSQLEINKLKSEDITTLIVLELDEAPNVRPIPTIGKPFVVSSETKREPAKNLFDGDILNKWHPKDEDTILSIEVDLLQEELIGAFAVAEPWSPWEHDGLNVELFYKNDGEWISFLKTRTTGEGYLESFSPVKARHFKMRIEREEKIWLNEFVLYRHY